MNISRKKHAGYDPLGDCGKGRCPICIRNNTLAFVKEHITGTEFSSDSNSVFVGTYNYPNINVGILAPPVIEKEPWLYDAPNYWAQQNYSIPQIVDLRSSLLNSRRSTHIFTARQHSKFLELGQELAMAARPTALDVTLEDKPIFRLETDSYALPMGPPAKLKDAQLTENPKIENAVEKAVSDTDLKASDALAILYQRHVSEHQLTKLLSIGNLGIQKDRKLVPTRWAITGVDSTLGNQLAAQVKDFSQIGWRAFYGGYLGNYFLILFFPEVWSYELFETYVPPKVQFGTALKFTTDFEPYAGRKKYAQETAGGFYAARLAILEKLLEIKRQASVLTLRFITDEYSMPLGVFVVREAVRKTLAQKPIEFGSRELMLNYAKILITRKFGWDIGHLFARSLLMKSMSSQMKLGGYF